MQKLKKILILLLITFLSSCDDFPTIPPQERCVIILESDSGPYCRCHLYHWSAEGIGRIGESKDYDVMKCDKLIGFSPDSSGAIYAWQESVRLWLKRKGR
ncbi:MAG: hypothetical protein RIQ94_184 [Pseudomonadota bacterium]|jgi:hypothetical protein